MLYIQIFTAKQVYFNTQYNDKYYILRLRITCANVMITLLRYYQTVLSVIGNYTEGTGSFHFGKINCLLITSDSQYKDEQI